MKLVYVQKHNDWPKSWTLTLFSHNGLNYLSMKSYVNVCIISLIKLNICYECWHYFLYIISSLFFPTSGSWGILFSPSVCLTVRHKIVWKQLLVQFRQDIFWKIAGVFIKVWRCVWHLAVILRWIQSLFLQFELKSILGLKHYALGILWAPLLLQFYPNLFFFNFAVWICTLRLTVILTFIFVTYFFSFFFA